MKKTLMALAVLATAGTASAQDSLSLSGTFGAGVQRGTASGNKGHLGITDGSLAFTGSEDLGDGLNAKFNLTTDFFRWKAASSEASNGTLPEPLGDQTVGATTDVFLALAGGFGTVKIGQWESLSTAWNIGNVAPISTPIDMYETGRLIQPSNRATRVSYATPSMNGVIGTVLFSDRTINGDKLPALSGSEVSATLGLTYIAGPLSVGFSGKNLNNEDMETYQLGAAYDFGVAKVGAGVDQIGKGLLGALSGRTQGERLGYLLSVAAPVGPVTLGATVMQSKIDGFTSATPDQNGLGYALAAEYSLSKRTALNATIAKFDDDAFENDASYMQGQYRLKLIHSF